MSTLSVLVVDDEPLARRRLIRQLGKLGWISGIEEAADVEEAFEKVKADHPDILLLDIQMPGGSGFDLLDKLRDEMPAVVFVTAFDHHALRAFSVNAIDYVTKPVDPGRLRQALERAHQAALTRHQSDRLSELQETVSTLRRLLSEQRTEQGEFWVKVRGEHLRIAQEKVIRFQAERDYVRIHVDGANYLYQETLASLEQRLAASGFLRIHRSTLVRREALVRLKPGPFAALIAVLSDGSEIRVGRTYAASVRMQLMKGL